MSNEGNRSELSDDAILKAEQESSGPASRKPITRDDLIKMRQLEAKNLSITNVDVLASPGEIEDKEKREKQAYATSLAVADMEMKAQSAEINRRMDSGSFLMGSNWAEDIKLVKAYAQNYFEKLDKDPSSVTKEEAATAFKAGMQLVKAADTPEKQAEIANDPYLRKIRNYAMEMEERMLCDPNSKIDPNLSHDERIKQIEAELLKLPKEKFDDLNVTCNKEAKSCEMIFHTEAERAEFSIQRQALNKVMIEDHSNELVAIRGISDPTKREEAFKDLQNKAIATIAEKDPAGAKILSEKYAKFNNSDSIAKFNELYKNISDSLNGKEVVTSLGNQDRKNVLDEFKANGEVSQATFDKAAKILLPDLKANFPELKNMTEQELKDKYASDPAFRKEISKVLEQGVREFDHEHQGIPIEGIQNTAPKYTWNLSSIGSYFNPPSTPNMSPIEAHPNYQKSDKSPPDGLQGDALAQVQAIKEKQDKMPSTVAEAKAAQEAELAKAETQAPQQKTTVPSGPVDLSKTYVTSVPSNSGPVLS